MKLEEILNEFMLDSIKSKLGSVKGVVVSSLKNLLLKFKSSPNAQLTTIETFNIVNLSKDFVCRVDTGALTCSISAKDVKIDDKKVTFTVDGKTITLLLERIKNVKSANGVSDRPVVLLTYKWNNKTYPGIETTLADRSKLKFPCLIGRNLITELKLPVHISDKEESD